MRKITVKIYQEYEKEVDVLIEDDADESKAIEKVEKMLKSGETKITENDMVNQILLEK